MADTFSFEDAQAPAQAQGRGDDSFSFEDAQAPAQPQGPQASSLQKAVGGLANIADMVVSTPGMLVGMGAEMAAKGVGGLARVTGLSKESNKEIAQSAQRIGQEAAGLFPKTPFESLMRITGNAEGYGQSEVARAVGLVGKWVGKGGEWVEKQTKGAVLKEDFEALANEAMLVGGPQVVSKGIGKAWDSATAVKKPAGAPGNYEMFQGLVEPEVKPDLAAPMEFEKVPVEPSLEPMNKAPKPEGMDYTQHAAEERSRGMIEKEQALDRSRKEHGEWEQEVLAQRNRTPAGEGMVYDPSSGKFKFASEGVKGATPDTLTSTGHALASAADKVSKGQGFAMSAEEKVAWKQHKAELAQDSDTWRQRGAADPKTLAATGAIGVGALAAAYAANDNKGAAAVLGAFGVAGALLIGKTLNGKFSEISPKAKYVKDMSDKFGPEFKEAAAYHWEQNNRLVDSAPKLEGGTITERAGSLEDGQHTLKTQREADKIRAKQYIKSLSPEEFNAASSEEMYNSRPDESLRADKPLSPEMAAAKAKVIDPLVKDVERLYEEAVKLGGVKELEGLNPHNIRSTKRSWLQKVSKFGQDAFPSTGFARKAGTMKDRSMFGLQMPDGSLRVVSQDGLNLNGFGPNKQPTGRLARSDKQLRVGDTVEVQGGQAKLVQVPTRMIESQTGIQYNKNVLANYLSAHAELKSYIREKKWLQETLKGMEKEGLAVPVDKVQGAPKGYARLQGEGSLERYYIQGRLANAFSDGILKSSSPVNTLERINTAAVGTMFWNPEPHLFNALDHWVNTMGWDLVNPAQYKSIAQSVYSAYKDVSTLSPEYLKMLDSGMGLQYGRIASEGVLEGVVKGIPESSWASMAKEWGYGSRPDKLIADIYKGSKHVLWGGSDVMMISAYKHLASQRGVDIFNKALRGYVEAHNPNYRVPANIGFDTISKIPGMNEALAENISRTVSKAMQSRAFNTFGRYHYGQFRSMGSNIHDLVVQDSKSVQSRGQALSHMAFTAFNLGVVYPYIWDTVSKAVSGDPQAEMRRSGAATIPYTLWHMALGDEKVTKLISEAFSLPPITKAIVEGANNRQLFTGQHIWEPEDNGLGKANDVGLWMAGSLVAPVRTATDIAKGKGADVAAGQLGVKLHAEDKKVAGERRKLGDVKAAKRRQDKRGYFRDDE